MKRRLLIIICLSVIANMMSPALIHANPEFFQSKQSGFEPFVVSSLLKRSTHGSTASVQNKEPAKRNSPIFIFHSDEFWLNMHHFLYVLGRAQNKERDISREAVAGAPADQQAGFAKLTPKEQALWREAVDAYAAGLSKKDIVFDDPLPAITNTLALAGDSKSLAGSKLDSAIVSVLERAASIYRRVWWKKHHQANRNWQKATQTLVDRHGQTILNFLEDRYQLKWPAGGFPIHISAYANWAGAYSVTGNVLVVSSGNPSVQGLYGLETVFHEGMHQWDDQVFTELREQAVKINKFFPRGLSHSLIFFTAGEAVRRVAPEHVPYAEKFGVWQRGLGPMKVALEEAWKPYLNGRGTRDEAFAALIKLTAVQPNAR